MEVDHRELLTLLDDLMKPISTVKSNENDLILNIFLLETFDILVSNQDEEQEQILTINLIFSNACDRFLEANKSIDLTIPLDPNQPAYFRYIQIHLNLLEKLLLLEEKNLSSHLPLFSIQDESILSRSLSFVILLGLILHFDEGIYLSLENYLKNSNTSIHLLKLKSNLTHDNRMSNLNEILNILIKWLKTMNINLFIIQRLYSNYFLELILSHLQLLYSPNLKYSSKEFSSENFDYLQNKFPKLFIQQILFLNRLLSTTVNSPMWLKKQCGDLLTSILINKNNQGIRQLLQIILDSSVPNDQLYFSISKILSTCPKQLKPEEYFQSIKSQLIELIHDKRYMPIICITINNLLKKYRNLVENELFSILLKPLITCRNDEICSDEEFERFLDDLYNLIDIQSNEEIRNYFYENYLNELINIYLALEKSLSSLKIKFFNILIRIFSSIDTEKFEKILFNFEYLPLKYLPDDSLKFHLINEKNSENNLEIFCQIITKILFSIENNHQLIMKIFLHLLQLLITTDNQNEQIFLWTENEKQINIKQFIIMQILKNIMEYLTEHMELFIQSIDDTIRVIQVLIVYRREIS